MPAGTPDGQLITQWRGDQLLAAYSQTLAPGDHPSGAQLVTSWRGVHIHVFPGAGSGRVTLSWFSDVTEAQQVATDQWGVNPAAGLNVVVPSKGPVCDLHINVTSAGSMTASTLLAGVNNCGSDIEYPVTGNFLNTGTLSVPASGTSDTVLPLVQGGLAKLSFVPSDALGKLTLIVARYSEALAFTDQLANYQQPTAAVNDLVGLVDDICGVHVINTDAGAAHSFQARLVAGLSH